MLLPRRKTAAQQIITWFGRRPRPVFTTSPPLQPVVTPKGAVKQSADTCHHDVQALMPQLAYTTVMTTLRRLADKGLLTARAEPGRRAHEYRAAGTAADYLARASHDEAAQFVARYGDAALSAFAARLADLTPEQRRRLEDLAG